VEELHHFWSSERPRRRPVREVIVSDAHIQLEDPSYLIADLEAFVVDLMQGSKVARADFPREALLAAAVAIYLGEAQNGGHAQVISNTEADPVLFADIREGLALFGLDAVSDVWVRFEAYGKSQPSKFTKADWRDPTLQALDAALNPRLRGAYAHLADQIMRWTFLRVLPGEQAVAAREALKADYQ